MMGRTHLLLGLNMLWLPVPWLPIPWLPIPWLPMLGLLAAAKGEESGTISDAFPLLIIGLSVGALLPDLDATNSLLQNVSLKGIRPFIWPAHWLNARYGHRGALHSLRGLAVATLLTSPLMFLPLLFSAETTNDVTDNDVTDNGVTGNIVVGLTAKDGAFLWIGLALGYGSHLLGDGCTKSGIPLFYPRPQRVHFLPPRWRLSTGSAAEEVVFVLLAVSAMALFLIFINLYEIGSVAG